MRKRIFLALAVLAGLWALPHAFARAAATTYQADPAHSGFVSDPALAGPLSERWSRQLGDEVSYPLIVGGRVYVSVDRDKLPTLLYALDARTGETLWTRTVHGGPAYDAGRIFTVGPKPQIYFRDPDPPIVLANDAATGAQRWRATLETDQWQYNQPPIASGGSVHVGGIGSGGRAHALAAADGSLRWSRFVQGYAGAALSPDALFVANGGCVETQRLDPLTGVQIWHFYAGCSGGGGSAPVFHAGRLYVRDHYGGSVLDAATGAALVSYIAEPAPPALAATTGVFLQPGGSMVGRRLPGLAQLWSFQAPQPFASAPLIVNGVAYATTVNGQLYGVALDSGRKVEQHDLDVDLIQTDRQDPHLDNGLAAGDGLLVVPAGGRLVAFAADGAPSVRGVPSDWSRASSETFEITSTGPTECRTDIDGDRGTWETCSGSLPVSQVREGDYRLLVRAAPPGTAPGPAAVRHWTVDRTPPKLRLTKDIGAFSQLTLVFMFRADEPVRYECELDGDPDGGSTGCNGQARWDLVQGHEGEHDFRVTAVDRAGNRSVPQEHHWTIQQVPTIAITGQPSEQDMKKGIVWFEFTSGTPGEFTCTMEGPEGTSSQPCESRVTYDDLGEGTHRFTVVATASDGSRSGASSEFRIEQRVPTASIVRGPAGVVTSRRASFSFMSDEMAPRGLASDQFPSFMCRLEPEDAEWHTCLQDPAWEHLGDGRHRLLVQALDEQWNRSAVVARSWIVDATPPTVTIATAPEHGALAFTTDDHGAKASCRLNRGLWAACASPVAVPAAGRLEVRAVDAAGNTGAPADRTWGDHVPAPTPPAAAPTASGPAALGLRMRILDRRLAPVLRRGLRLRIASSRASAARLSLRRGKRGVAPRRAARLTVRARTLRVRLSRSARRRLAARGRAVLTVSVSARAADGGRARLSRRVVLTRPQR